MNSTIKTASVPEKSVGSSGSLSLTSSNSRISLARSTKEATNVFSARAQARAAVVKQQGKSAVVPLIARTTSAHADNVTGLNRPYIQVLSLGNDPGQRDATNLKDKSNFYDTFIVTSVNISDAEKLDVVETFGKPHFFASGSFTKKVMISGVVRSQARNPGGTTILNKVPDYVVFRNFYENYLRATLQAASNTFTRVYVDGDYYDGFVQNLTFNISAESEQTIPWAMNMLLIRSWNANDNSAKSILETFMSALSTERTPITDRAALMEIQDTKGVGVVRANGLPVYAESERSYVNGEAANATSSVYLELRESNIGVLTAEVPQELGAVVSLVNGAGKEVNGMTLKSGEKLFVKLKVNNIAALTEWVSGQPQIDDESESFSATISVKVYSNWNIDGGCSISFPIKVSGGDSLQISNATYTDGRTNLELIGAITTGLDKVTVVFDVPVENQTKFFSSTGLVSGNIALKLKGKDGSPAKVTETSAVKTTHSSSVVASTAALAPSREDTTNICNPIVVNNVDPSGLSSSDKATLLLAVSSENPAFHSATPINPFPATEVVLYTILGVYSVPGYEDRNVEIKFVVKLPTPSTFKGVIIGPATIQVQAGTDSKILTIQIPIATSAYVNGVLPSTVKAKLEETMATVEITAFSSTVYTGGFVLRQGTNATLTTKDQIDASGRTSIRVFKSRIDTENVGVFLYRAKLLYINETGDTYSNVAIPAAKVNITDPFKAPK